MFRTALLYLSCLVALSIPASGHEFWIAPDRWQAKAGETVRADLRVGQDMSGEIYPWLRRNVLSATLWSQSGEVEVKGREGDLPALSVVPAEVGLHRLAYQSTPSFVIFDTMEKFAHYLDYEGLGGIADRHRARGLPEEDFGEEYSRHARALVQIGPPDAADVDTPTGMPFELVARVNPFVAGLAELPVQLTYLGTAAENVQVAVFFLPDGGTAPQDVTRQTYRTDAQGRVTVPLSGAGDYLLSAVRIEEVPPSDTSVVVWRSDWASLTFGISP